MGLTRLFNLKEILINTFLNFSTDSSDRIKSGDVAPSAQGHEGAFSLLFMYLKKESFH